MNKNSMLYWFPKLKNTLAHIPRTELVPVDKEKYQDFISCIDDPESFPNEVLDRIKVAARNIGFPVFLRTDHLSGKHSYHPAKFWVPFVGKEQDLLGHILALVETSAMASIIGLPINGFAVREYISLEADFKAFCGMPVARERRYFIDKGQVLCHHPYWIQDAIEDNFWTDHKEPEGWKQKLAFLNTETEDEVKILSKYASDIATVFPEYWSVDFAHAQNGDWFLIDMAIGYNSWHGDCKMKLEKKETT